MKHIEELRDMLCEELDKIAQKGELSAGTLETVDKLSHSIKSLDTIMAMEDYSEDGMYYDDGGSYTDGTSYARGRGSNAKRDSMGRYSRRGSYARGGKRGYSGHGGNEEVVDMLEDMMKQSTDEKERMAIRKVINLIEE